MIFLTYINYRAPEFKEDLVIVFVEYTVVIIFGIIEWKTNYRLSPFKRIETNS